VPSRTAAANRQARAKPIFSARRGEPLGRARWPVRRSSYGSWKVSLPVRPLRQQHRERPPRQSPRVQEDRRIRREGQRAQTLLERVCRARLLRLHPTASRNAVAGCVVYQLVRRLDARRRGDAQSGTR